MKMRRYIRMLFNPATGNYDWRVEFQWSNGEITPKLLGRGWHKGKPTVADTHDVAFSKTRIQGYMHN